MNPQCVVIEMNSVAVRGGFAGEDSPRFIIATDFLKFNDESRNNYMLDFFSSLFLNQLQTRAKDCRVLLIEDITSSRSFRDDIINIFLKDLQVVLSVSLQPGLFTTLLTTGCTCGLVIEIGEQESKAIAIVNGRPILYTLKISSVGTYHAANQFHKMLLTDWEIANIDKKLSQSLFYRVSCAMTSNAAEGSQGLSDVNVTSENFMINSSSHVIKAATRSNCLTILTTGDCTDIDCNDEGGGIVGLLLTCLEACSVDIRSMVAKHIVFTGIGADIPGLPSLICEKATACISGNITTSHSISFQQSCHSLKGLLKTVMTVPDQGKGQGEGRLLPAPTPFVRSLLPWIGGSLFASVKGNEGKFCRSDDLKSYHTTSSSSAVDVDVEEVNESIADIRLRAPDWMSLDDSDWKCFGPTTNTEGTGGGGSAISILTSMNRDNRDSILSPKGSLNKGSGIKTAYNTIH